MSDIQTDTQQPAPSEQAQDAAETPVKALDPGSTPDAAADDPQKERIPIVWTGRPKDPPSGAVASENGTKEKAGDEAIQERPAHRLKPNAAFLLNVVADAERGNKRKCAEEATQVSLNVLSQAVSAGVRPQLARVGVEAVEGMLRRVVLSVAQQQRLAACSALLREVAATFGFTLHIMPDVGDEDQEEEAREVSASEGVRDSGDDGLPGEGRAAVLERGGCLALQPLHVQLNLASRKEKEAKAKPNRAAACAVQDDADTAQRAPKPRVPALNMAASRLAGAALGAIGVAIPDTATAPHKPKAADKGPAKAKGRAGLFAHEASAAGAVDEEEKSANDDEYEGLQGLQDDDDEDDMDGLFGDAAGGVPSEEQSADGHKPSSNRVEAEPASGARDAVSFGVVQRLALGTPLQTSTGVPQGASQGGPLASRLGSAAPKAPAVSRAAPERAESSGGASEELEEEEDAAPKPPLRKRLRSSAGAGLHMDSVARQQRGKPPSVASRRKAAASATESQPKAPAVDMARLLARASAAANAQPRGQPHGRASVAASSNGHRSEAGASNEGNDDDDDDCDDAEADNVMVAAQKGRKPGARQLQRGKRSGVEGVDVGEEEQVAGTGKRGTKPGRGVFGAAMAGLTSRKT